MSSIFMGPYPTRFSRLRCCTAAVDFSASARGTDATATVATTTTTTDAAAAASAALVAVPPPRLCALHTMRKITNTPMQRQSVADALYFISSSSVAPTPSSLPMLAVGATAADALNSLSLQTAPVSTQLAKLPVRVLTQLVQWRQSRNCCASVLTSVVGDANLYGSHSCMLSARTPRRGLAARLRFSIRWTAAMKASEAAANVQPTATPLVLLAPASALSPASSCGAAQSIVSGSAAATADSSSTGAAVSTPVGPLYTVRRCYSSAASADGPTAATASASSTPQPEDAAVQAALDSAAGNSEYSGQRSEERETRAADSSSSVHERVTEEKEKGKGGFEAVEVPSFAEIYWAFRTLQLVQDDDRVVREWTAAHVKQAYRTLAKQLHPDVAGGDDELMERVNTSYELLMDMSTELADNYRMWLETGGEAELQLQCAQDEQELLGSRWRSCEVEQLMMVGWCATLSGFAMYAVWRTLYGTSPVVNSVGSATAIGGSASSGRSKVHCNIKVAGVHTIGTRLTLPRAGITVSTAAGVQYGVVSMGDSVLWMRPHLSFRLLQRVRRAVSRYALTLALTLATWMNSVMLQHAFQRMLVSGSGEAAR